MTTTATSSYWTVLRTPRVPSLLAAGALGRMPGGILPFALVVAFARQDGFAIAGAAAAVFMLATALTGPRRGRLVDRNGTAALFALTVIQAGCATATTALIWAHWTVPALVAVAACSATAPPVSAALRARWSGAVTNEDQLRQVHSIDSIVEEITLIVAPLVATARHDPDLTRGHRDRRFPDLFRRHRHPDSRPRRPTSPGSSREPATASSSLLDRRVVGLIGGAG